MSLNARNDIEVSLDISSETMTLHDLERSLSIRGDSGSRSHGEVLPGARSAQVTVLRVGSRLDRTASLLQQLEAIRRQLPADRLVAADIAVRVVFSIALYFDTAYATTTLESEVVDLMHEYVATIQVVAYPVVEKSSN